MSGRRQTHPADIYRDARMKAGALNRRDVLQLQRAIGNRAVAQLLAETERHGTSQKKNGTGLPDDLKAGAESLSGVSLADVMVHYNSARPAELDALAYTQGTDIHVAPGQERHLPHETWHVVQQKQGRVRPTLEVHGVAVNSDHSLEREADEMGAKTSSPGRHAGRADPRPTPRAAPTPAVIQGVFTEEQKQRIAQLSSGTRIKFLADASREDLDDYYESEYHGRNYLGAEEADEIRELRREKAARGQGQGVREAEPDDPDIDALVGRMSGLSLDDKDADGDVLMELEPIRIERDEYHADGDVEMTSIDGTVDVDMHDVYGSMDITMRRVEGYVALDIDRAHGDIDIDISDVQGSVHLTLMDIDLEEASDPPGAEPRYARMQIEIREVAGALDVRIIDHSQPMELAFGPVEAEERAAKRVSKRKRAEPEPESPTKEEDGPPGKKTRLKEPERAASAEEPEFSVEDLTESFSNLSVSFRSDVDNEMHEIYPARDYGDLIVESNPTPLDTIIKQATWQNIALAGAVLVTLTNLGVLATQRLKTFGTKRTKTAGLSLRDTMKAIAKQLKGLATSVKLPKTNLSGSTYYGSNAGNTEGTYVKADPLSLNSNSVGHGPSGTSRLMESIKNAAGTQSKSYKRMHLLNDNVFGPGELWNLTPGPAQSNVDMEKRIETPLKRAILDKGLVMTLEATVHYPHDPVAATDTEIDQDPNKYRFTQITFKAKEHFVDAAKGKYVPGANKDPDIKAINGAVLKWQWGNLTPLKAKPKILDKATTVADLQDAGIPPAAAKRIVAYIKNNPKPALASKDKRGQLATLIQAYDGMKTKISTKWDATKVLWS